ncbi:MAG: hypothetical protein CM1200mP37_2620 [Chloroflexota bacterium]|nr:MAG: hypothetical protein CM1200mP37_2620 [Chloroflexota bacterium]
MVTNFAGIIIWTNNFPTLTSFYKKILYKIPYSEKTNFISFKKDSFRLGIGTHSKVHKFKSRSLQNNDQPKSFKYI